MATGKRKVRISSKRVRGGYLVTIYGRQMLADTKKEADWITNYERKKRKREQIAMKRALNPK